MRKLVYILLFIPFFTQANDRDESRIYSFLNQIIDQWNVKNKFDGPPPYYIINEPDFTLFDKYLLQTDSLYLDYTIESPFSKADSIYIFKCAKKYGSFSFENKLTGAKLLPRKTVNRAFKKYKTKSWWYLQKTTGAKAYISISVPIFFDSGNKAIFYHGYHCDGLCGGGEVAVYENVNNTWIKKIVVLVWRG